MSVKLDVLLIQLVNIGLLFWILKKLLWGFMSNWLAERDALQFKLDNANAVYDEAKAEAEAEKKAILADAQSHKVSLIEEAKTLAEKTKESIIAGAHAQEKSILEQAQAKLGAMEQELKDAWEASVKSTAEIVVRKLFKKDVTLQQAYLEEAVKEVKAK